MPLKRVVIICAGCLAFVVSCAEQASQKSENVAVVENLYDAFASGDIDTVLSYMDPEIDWREAENFPYADGNPYIGPDAVAEGVFVRIGSEWDNWRLDVQEIHESDAAVIAFGRYKARHKGTAREINAQFVHVWRIRDGKAASFQQYADTLQVVNAMTDVL